jgi:hypothetical protein
MSTPSNLEADSGAPEVSAKLPSDFFVPTLATDTVDDDDDRGCERADENEAPLRAKYENTDAAEEFQYNDEDRNDARHDRSIFAISLESSLRLATWM